MRRIKWIGWISLALLTIAGCGTTTSVKDNPDAYTIYTTVYPVQFIVDRLGGGEINVQSIYPPGADAHTYEPTSKEMTAIAKADAFIFLGGEMEAFAETTARAIQEEKVKNIELNLHESLFRNVHSNKETDSSHTEEEHNTEDSGHNHGDHDPHIWLDPVRMIELTTILEKELVSMIPEKADAIRSNAGDLIEELKELDQSFQAVIEKSERKEILVSHAAYGYWEQRYGVEQFAISGISSSSEPSQKELITIIEEAEEANIEYIIFEQNISSSVSEKIQQEIGAEPLYLHNLAVLTKEDISNKEDYFSIMYHNLEVLETALSN